MTDLCKKSPPDINPIRKSTKNSKINNDRSDTSSEVIIEYLKLEELSLERHDSDSSINTELSVENELTPKVDVNCVKSAQGSHAETFLIILLLLIHQSNIKRMDFQTKTSFHQIQI